MFKFKNRLERMDNEELMRVITTLNVRESTNTPTMLERLKLARLELKKRLKKGIK